MPSAEGRAVQDADRLDALGAIGIARAFSYGARAGRSMHDPDSAPQLHGSFDEYRLSSSATTAHFYEKLLLLRDRLHTGAGRRVAEGRHQFMELYLEHFFGEWNGEE